MPVFFKVILILILGWYLFKLFLRFMLPVIIAYLAKRTIKKMNARFNQDSSEKSYQNKGKNNDSDRTAGKKENMGEYVDYEEIKE